jgi:hypothetical protein
LDRCKEVIIYIQEVDGVVMNNMALVMGLDKWLGLHALHQVLFLDDDVRFKGVFPFI